MGDKDIKEISFDGFRVDGERRLLFKDGEAVPLKAKTFDLLLALVENRGQLLTKNELLDLVWENQLVAENNLSVHIAALRKALGETKDEHRYIVTLPGKGYQFVGELNGSNGLNGSGGHELVVERHRIQRIVVEENGRGNGLTEAAALGRLGLAGETLNANASPATPVAGRRRTVVVVLAVLILGTLTGSYFLVRRWMVPQPALVPFAQVRIRQLTTNGKVGNAALSPDGKLFAYTVDELGQKSLWMGFVAGGTQRQLRAPADATIRSLTFSPDSNELYFLLRDELHPKTSLYKMPASGGVETLVRDDIGDFALAPDGKRIAYAKSDDAAQQESLMIGPIEGGEGRALASFPADRAFDSSALAWSADGKSLAACVQAESHGNAVQLIVIDTETGKQEKVPHRAFQTITRTLWARDGKGLIVTAGEPPVMASVPQYRLYYVAVPGGATRLLTPDLSNYGPSWQGDAGVSLSLADGGEALLSVEHRQVVNIWIAPAHDLSAAKQITFGSFGKYDGLWGLDWTPDGALVYTTSDTKSQFLATVNADGTGAKDLTTPGTFDSTLTVSADGKYVLFHSGRSSPIDIWRMDRDGANLKQLTFGGQGYHPAPSADGKWVYYKSLLDGSGALFRVPMDGGQPERVTEGAAWWPSFSPDGRYFAALYKTDKTRLAIFSAATNEVVKQFELPRGGTLYMGSRWTPDSKGVTFRDRNYGYWIQPIDGGEAHRLEGLPKERLYNFSWSRDGKSLAFVRGPEIRDVVLIENVAN